jgi:hypothetical protein
MVELEVVDDLSYQTPKKDSEKNPLKPHLRK